MPFRIALCWIGKNGDFKDVINQLAVILDPKQVPWAQRVGVAIGRARPTGDLAPRFLGNLLLMHFGANFHGINSP